MILFIGVSGGELFFIIFIAVMLFGANKIPEFARTFGKAMRQLRDATNNIKNEIHSSAENSGLDTSVVEDVQNEINKAKEEIVRPIGQIKRNL